MKAVILAAGKGTRMGDLTAHVPKPMKEVEGKPILQHIIEGLRDAAGVRAVTLAFVTAQGGDRCVPSWGGVSAYPASGPGAYELAQLRSYRDAGGSVVPSFGGASGAELATVCGSVGALETAYAKVISAYHVDHLDFDIEGADASNFAAAKRRAAALAGLQTAAATHGRVLRVSLTLPALPSGGARWPPSRRASCSTMVRPCRRRFASSSPM